MKLDQFTHASQELIQKAAMLAQERRNTVSFIEATSAFLASYGYPHNASLAQQGKAMLADAKYNAQAISARDWRIVAN